MLDEATGKWGIRVNRVELKGIDPPPSIKDSMEKQMRADREKRAVILTAEGQRQAAILTAEGDKQSSILNAEGDREALILRAQADRESPILRAQGEGQAIQTVFQAIHDGQPDQSLLAYQYLQMMPQDRRGRRQQGVGRSRRRSPRRSRASARRSTRSPGSRRRAPGRSSASTWGRPSRSCPERAPTTAAVERQQGRGGGDRRGGERPDGVGGPRAAPRRPPSRRRSRRHAARDAGGASAQ